MPFDPVFCPVHLPLGHVTQAAFSELRNALCLPYLPLGHIVHWLSPWVVWYCPLGQGSQDVQPVWAGSPPTHPA